MSSYYRQRLSLKLLQNYHTVELRSDAQSTSLESRQHVAEASKVIIDVAQTQIDHGQPFEIMAHDEIVDHTHGAVHLHRLLSDQACGLTYVRLGPRYGASALGRVVGIGVYRRDDGHRACL